jgi:preprotein translocase subunit YajC
MQAPHRQEKTLDRIYDLYASAHPFLAQAEMAGGQPANGASGAAPAAARPPQGCGGPEQLIFMVLMLVVFYFLLIRPQQKRMKQHKAMVEGLKRGDSVITSSGIYGRIASIEGNVLTIEIAKGTNIRILKSYVGGVANEQTEKDLTQNPQQPQAGS